MKAIKNLSNRAIGIGTNPAIILQPGESRPMDPEALKDLHEHMVLSKWFASGVLGVVDHGVEVSEPEATDGPPDPDPVPSPSEEDEGPREGEETAPAGPEDLPEGITGHGGEIQDCGGGWFIPYFNGVAASEKAVRREQAEEILAEFNTEE